MSRTSRTSCPACWRRLTSPRSPGEHVYDERDAQLLDAGIDASVGTVGDALDNALMESQIGLKPPEPTDAHPPLPPLLTGPPAMQARAARPISLTASERARLKKAADGHNTEHRLRIRAQTVLSRGSRVFQHAHRPRDRPVPGHIPCLARPVRTAGPGRPST